MMSRLALILLLAGLRPVCNKDLLQEDLKQSENLKKSDDRQNSDLKNFEELNSSSDLKQESELNPNLDLKTSSVQNTNPWSDQKVIWTKFNLIPKPVLSNFTKSFHNVLKNSKTPRPISTKLNASGPDPLTNVTERRVPVSAVTLSSKIVGFPEDRTVPTARPRTTTVKPSDAVPRRRRRPVIRYEEEEEEEDDEEDEDEEDDITDEFVEDDDDDEDEEEEVEVVEEVPAATIDIKQPYEDTYPEPVAIQKTKRIKKKSKKYLKLKDFKKLRKFMLPLLLAYKLKFFTLIPLLIGGLVLIVGTTGFAGFFFALFAVGLGLQKNNHG